MKVQGFLLTQAGWGGAGQEKGPGGEDCGRGVGRGGRDVWMGWGTFVWEWMVQR